MEITGTVSYREHMALPPNAVVDVKLVETPAAGGSREVLAQVHLKPDRQVPVPYKLELERDRIKSDRTYALQALISVDGRPWFFGSARYGLGETSARIDILVQRITTAADHGGDNAIFGEWKVQTIRDMQVANDVVSSIGIATDGSVKGNGGCNSFVGQSKVNGDQITFGDMARTLKSCLPPVTSQEEKFLDVLADVKGWRVRSGDGYLEFIDSNGKVIAILSRL
jgi:putative lipoprotein